MTEQLSKKNTATDFHTHTQKYMELCNLPKREYKTVGLRKLSYL